MESGVQRETDCWRENLRNCRSLPRNWKSFLRRIKKNFFLNVFFNKAFWQLYKVKLGMNQTYQTSNTALQKKGAGTNFFSCSWDRNLIVCSNFWQKEKSSLNMPFPHLIIFCIDFFHLFVLMRLGLTVCFLNSPYLDKLKTLCTDILLRLKTGPFWNKLSTTSCHEIKHH